MINIRLVGHSLQYEVGELVKLFYFGEKLQFVDSFILSDKSIQIESELRESDGVSQAITRIKKGGKLVSEHTEYINRIDILEDDKAKIEKIGIKKSIYLSLSEVEKIRIPWGILTGIRPTKIIHGLFERGYSYEEIVGTLSREYLLSSQKIELIRDIASIEKDIIYPLDRDRYSIYISIPFCPTRCLYCSFPSNKLRSEEELDRYLDALICEIESMAPYLRRKKLHTLYIGGGTPTTLTSRQIDRLMKTLYRHFELSAGMEITVEAGRPDTIDREKLEMLKSHGVNRISINPQTMSEKTLGTIGRNHSVEDIINSYRLAREVGFDTINMDLIVGLPGESEKDVINTMEELVKLRPENLTVHTMAVKKSSRLKADISSYDLAEQGQIEAMLGVTKEYAEKMGMRPYYMYRQKQILGNFENVGYSIARKECVYNIMIMEEKESIMAFGAGAISKVYYPGEDRFERVPNVKNLKDYLERVDEMVERKKLFTEK